MAVLSFSLSPDATGRIYDALVCLSKFGDNVSLEARSEKLTITALNLSRTAYASFALDAKVFFLEYQFRASSSSNGGDRFTCQLLNKALQSVFKGRASEARGRESPIERCDVTIQEQPDRTECRLVIKMISKHGMTRTYRLTYESIEVMHALFDRSSATQGWRISSRVLREYIEFFGPKTEQLDLVAENDKAMFTSFTEKTTNGKVITLHTADFEDFHMQEQMHVVISVKDFRAVVTHAYTLGGPISAYFSLPTRPLQFSYQNFGMHCEYTFMTTGDFREASSTPHPKFVSTRSLSRHTSAAPQQTPQPPQPGPTAEMPPPTRLGFNKPLSSQSQRPSLREQVSQPHFEDPDPESLFLPEDRTWDPPNYDGNDDEEEEMLGWDAANERAGMDFQRTFRDSGSVAPPPRQPRQRDAPVSQTPGLEPTQRLSEQRGLFD
ncbi:Rad9-domain-containing protein [Hortaea werneckii]|nr:Rad9-domain-containing protein [Hortaea werneckii]KAI7060457.1 Rad9-domain-containing protein [Hortaea werneckii]